jgi:hypothetical protein
VGGGDGILVLVDRDEPSRTTRQSLVNYNYLISRRVHASASRVRSTQDNWEKTCPAQLKKCDRNRDSAVFLSRPPFLAPSCSNPCQLTDSAHPWFSFKLRWLPIFDPEMRSLSNILYPPLSFVSWATSSAGVASIDSGTSKASN